MIFPVTYPTVRNTEPRRRRCDCGCEDNGFEFEEPVSINIDNILLGEISSQYDPPPPYPGPGPSNDAPPPPYWTLYGPKMPYYEPPPPYIETTPAPRPQPVPVQYEASRPCKLGSNFRKDLFYVNVMVPITMPANFSVRPQS
uniref:SFRICE_040022 n=1 Tax=Spodoptera frugiperda TaxID=7108 RepID=A0A2H1VYJ6_SPOFR